MRSALRPRRSRLFPSPSNVVDLDPEDPSQQLDEAGQFHIEIAVEAQPNAESDEEVEAAIMTAEEDTEEILPPPTKDTGDLYGVHLPATNEPDLAAPEDQDAFRDAMLGQHFFDSLDMHAIENGPIPEHEIDVLDDSDVDFPTHHKTDHRDRPVADKGSGGTGGV
jgi:hypothetical protein